MDCCDDKISRSTNETVNAPFNLSTKDTLISLDLSKVQKSGLRDSTLEARVMRVYDGDTLTVAMSINNDSHYEAFQIRLYGCDAPEKKGNTKTCAEAAREEVLRFIGASGAIGLKRGKQENTWFQNNPIIVVIKFMSKQQGAIDKYGRELAHLYKSKNDHESLSDHLIKTGLAQPYNGGTKDQSMYEDS